MRGLGYDVTRTEISVTAKSERRAFSRSFTAPDDVDPDKIEARVTHGTCRRYRVAPKHNHAASPLHSSAGVWRRGRSETLCSGFFL